MSDPSISQKLVMAIIGSSRSNGNTRLMLDEVIKKIGAVDLVDLSTLAISPYEYDGSNGDDDYFSLARRMVTYNTILLATPVYWYAMSAQMKIFFDRLTDLTTTRKDLGRRLKDRHLYAIATSSSPTAPDGFETPFAGTAGYFDMVWGGFLHGYFEEDLILSPMVAREAARFGDNIMDALSI